MVWKGESKKEQTEDEKQKEDWGGLRGKRLERRKKG